MGEGGEGQRESGALSRHQQSWRAPLHEAASARVVAFARRAEGMLMRNRGRRQVMVGAR